MAAVSVAMDVADVYKKENVVESGALVGKFLTLKRIRVGPPKT